MEETDIPPASAQTQVLSISHWVSRVEWVSFGTRGPTNSSWEWEDMQQARWFVHPPGRVRARIWAPLDCLLPQGQELLHLYEHEEGEKRQVTKILDWMPGVPGTGADAANSAVTLG